MTVTVSISSSVGELWIVGVGLGVADTLGVEVTGFNPVVGVDVGNCTSVGAGSVGPLTGINSLSFA